MFPDPQLSQIVCQNFNLPLLYMSSFIIKSFEKKLQSSGIIKDNLPQAAN